MMAKNSSINSTMIKVAMAAMALGGCSSGRLEPGDIEDGKVVEAPFRIIPLASVTYDGEANTTPDPVSNSDLYDWGILQLDDLAQHPDPENPEIELTAAGNMFLNGTQTNLKSFESFLEASYRRTPDSAKLTLGARLVDHEGKTIASCTEGAWSYSFLNRLKAANDQMAISGNHGRLNKSETIAAMATICDVSVGEVQSVLEKLNSIGEVSMQLQHQQSILGQAPASLPPAVKVKEVSYGNGIGLGVWHNTGFIKS